MIAHTSSFPPPASALTNINQEDPPPPAPTASKSDERPPRDYNLLIPSQLMIPNDYEWNDNDDYDKGGVIFFEEAG